LHRSSRDQRSYKDIERGNEGSPLIPTLLLILVVSATVAGCFGGDPTYTALINDLDIEIERVFLTDHIWIHDGPHEPFNNETCYMLTYMRLINEGQEDLPLDDVLVFVYYQDTWDFWSGYLFGIMNWNLSMDPRFHEEILQTTDVVLPPGGSVAGWTLFTPLRSIQYGDTITVELAYIVDDNPILRKEFDLDTFEMDWGYPPMMSIERADLRFTNIYWHLTADRDERILIANLTLVDDWPVPIDLELESIALSDMEGAVHTPDRLVTEISEHRGIVEFDGSTWLELAFLVTDQEIPLEIELADSIVFRIDRDAIVETYVPCRLNLTLNFVNVTETSSERHLRFNVTVNNTSDEVVYFIPGRMRLVDTSGTLHDRWWQPYVSDTGLESRDLNPGEGVTGEIEYHLPLDVVAAFVEYDDYGRFLGVPIAGVRMETP
jgi:hypothetical protein